MRGETSARVHSVHAVSVVLLTLLVTLCLSPAQKEKQKFTLRYFYFVNVVDVNFCRFWVKWLWLADKTKNGTLCFCYLFRAHNTADSVILRTCIIHVQDKINARYIILMRCKYSWFRTTFVIVTDRDTILMVKAKP